jgi:hypothetical protein
MPARCFDQVTVTPPAWRGSRRVHSPSGSEADACTMLRHERRTRDEQEARIFGREAPEEY